MNTLFSSGIKLIVTKQKLIHPSQHLVDGVTKSPNARKYDFAYHIFINLKRHRTRDFVRF